MGQLDQLDIQMSKNQKQRPCGSPTRNHEHGHDANLKPKQYGTQRQVAHAPERKPETAREAEAADVAVNGSTTAGDGDVARACAVCAVCCAVVCAVGSVLCFCAVAAEAGERNPLDADVDVDVDAGVDVDVVLETEVTETGVVVVGESGVGLGDCRCKRAFIACCPCVGVCDCTSVCVCVCKCASVDVCDVCVCDVDVVRVCTAGETVVDDAPMRSMFRSIVSSPCTISCTVSLQIPNENSKLQTEKQPVRKQTP